jgi:20S proteasome subunit beta 2
MGSGSLAALSVLETRYKDGMTEEDAIELAADAIQAGIFYDLGSGSNINIFSVTKKECRKLYNYRVFNKKEYTNEELFKFPIGTTEVLSVVDKKWAKIEVEEVKDKMLLDI